MELTAGRETAIHEAGHAIAALALGLRFERASLSQEGAGEEGSVDFGEFQRDPRNLDSIGLREEIVVCMAGAASVVVVTEARPSGDGKDIRRAYELAAHLDDDEEEAVFGCNEDAKNILKR